MKFIIWNVQFHWIYKVVQHDHNATLEHFHHPKTYPVSISSHFPFWVFPSILSNARHQLMYFLSVYICLCVHIDISYKGNHTIVVFVTGFFYLMFWNSSMLYEYFIPFYYQITSHCMEIPLFKKCIHLGGHEFFFSFLAVMNNTAVND